MSRDTASLGPAMAIALRWGLPICPHIWRVIASDGDDVMAKAPVKTKAKPAPAPAKPAAQLRFPKPTKKPARRGK